MWYVTSKYNFQPNTCYCEVSLQIILIIFPKVQSCCKRNKKPQWVTLEYIIYVDSI